VGSRKQKVEKKKVRRDLDNSAIALEVILYYSRLAT
jgi:hypothetical protein